MRRARWQVGIGVLQRGAIPAAGGRYLAVELIGGLYSQCCDRLQSQQAAGDQQGKLSSKHEGFHCHLVNPGFLRAIGPVGRTPLDGLKRCWIIKHDLRNGWGRGEPRKCLMMPVSSS